ncbi:uncharacterized protein LOC111593355 [Drosophila hydei]|uniref:Uncharacterized protein LOC111593355 n=1 Tax=Drosophila hydei TaxID=7224 RepID=A0A6J1L7J4_DROHY|nr:uncharacterized protein LOC111593355 [Drosophila hydei]
MVNFNNSTKIVVNRCMELLNAKIAHAQTRHIAKRVPVNCMRPQKVDSEAILREREKVDNYKASKQLSMWQQKKSVTEDMPEIMRMDDSHYKHCDFMKRDYECTWANFPCDPEPKVRRTQCDETVQITRREAGNRPATAKPWDAEANNFIKNWGNNYDIDRNANGKLIQPVMREPSKCKLYRKKKFF